MPRLIFLIDDGAELAAHAVRDLEFGHRQHQFRRRLQRDGATTARVKNPGELELLLFQALGNLAPCAPTEESGSSARLDTVTRLTYLATLRRQYDALELVNRVPDWRDLGSPLSRPRSLAEVFVPQYVHGEENAIDERTVLEVIADPARQLLALSGGPGSGKTSLLRYVALWLSGGVATEEETHEKPLAWLSGSLPFLIDLPSYADPGWRSTQQGGGDLLGFVDHLNAVGQPALPRADLQTYLQGGGSAIMMFDRLHAIRDPTDRAKILCQIGGLTSQYPNLRVVVATRTTEDHGEFTRAGFAVYTLLDFDRDQIESVVNRWYGGPSRRGSQQLSDRRRATLLEAIDCSDSMRCLAGNPTLLTALLLVSGREELPMERHRLYSQVVDFMASHWDVNLAVGKSGVVSDRLRVEDKRELLGRVARRVRERAGSGPEDTLSCDDLVTEFIDYLRERHQQTPAEARMLAVAMLEQFPDQHFVLSEFATDAFGFTNSTLLDHCFADEIIHRFTATHELSEADLISAAFGSHVLDRARQESLLLVASQLHETFLARVVDHVLDLASARHDCNHHEQEARLLVFALSCTAEARCLPPLTAQGARLLRALTSHFDEVREGGADCPRSEMAAVATQLRAAVGAVRGIRGRFPGREIYLDWCWRTLFSGPASPDPPHRLLDARPRACRPPGG